MAYFDFESINKLATQFHEVSDEQLFSNEKYFNFRALVEQKEHLESWALFFIIAFLVFIWYKLFAWYDKA